MSKAFKCDVCKHFVKGHPNKISFMPSDFHLNSQLIDICDDCVCALNDLFVDCRDIDDEREPPIKLITSILKID